MDPHATAGRIVHYHAAAEDLDRGSRAAIVNVDTGEDGLAELTVLFSTGPLVYTSVKYAELPTVGCWSWMPYQKAKAELPNGNQSESAEPRPEKSSEDLTKARGGHMASMPEQGQRAPDISGAAAGQPDSPPDLAHDGGGPDEAPDTPDAKSDDV